MRVIRSFYEKLDAEEAGERRRSATSWAASM
jgi:hypothetical protein